MYDFLDKIISKEFDKLHVMSDEYKLKRISVSPRFNDLSKSRSDSFNVLLVKIDRRFIESQNSTVGTKSLS